MPFERLRWLNSLRIKVLLAYITGAALSIVLMVLVTAAILTAHDDILSGDAVAERAEDLAEVLLFDANGVPAGFNEDESWENESLKTEMAYRVLDASGKVVLTSPAGEAFWPRGGDAGRLEAGPFDFNRGGIEMRGATETVEHEGKTWFVQFAASTRFVHLIFHSFALPFTGAGIIVFSLVLLFVFAACGYAMMNYTLRPLREISESATAISPQSLHARLQSDAAPTEIRPLVNSFNRALERLEHGYRVQQEFLATAAHELKTPLALIRAQIEVGVDESGRQDLLRDVSLMGRQVQQLLLLAEASEAQNYSFASVDTRSLLCEVVNYMERLASRQGVTLRVVVTPGSTLLRADRGALFTLLKNLLENAIQHSRAGSAVHVRAEPHLISVQDEGPGVSPGDLPKLFTRFWRGADRRDLGAGLGLSICREIATVHGWSLEARRAEPGMIFEILL